MLPCPRANWMCSIGNLPFWAKLAKALRTILAATSSKFLRHRMTLEKLTGAEPRLSLFHRRRLWRQRHVDEFRVPRSGCVDRYIEITRPGLFEQLAAVELIRPADLNCRPDLML